MHRPLRGPWRCCREVCPRERSVVSGLVARCLDGDDAAKAEFINTYGEFVRRAVARKLATLSAHPPVRQDVDDIANDILVRLLDNDCALLASIREHRSINAWLLVVCGNYTIDYVRRWSNRMRLQGAVAREEPAAYSPAPASALVEEEKQQAIATWLAELPDRDRIVLELYYTHGKKYAEIAETTGQNINTVATNIRRARARLRGVVMAADEMEGIR